MGREAAGKGVSGVSGAAVSCVCVGVGCMGVVMGWVAHVEQVGGAESLTGGGGGGGGGEGAGLVPWGVEGAGSWDVEWGPGGGGGGGEGGRERGGRRADAGGFFRRLAMESGGFRREAVNVESGMVAMASRKAVM